MRAGFVRVNMDDFEKLKADLKKNGGARVHVGVLGGFTERRPAPGEDGESQPANNAQIGAAHEFGVVTKNLPPRSFLRMPVIQEMPAAMQKTDRQLWHRVILQKGIRGALALLGAYALDVIHLAFETGGFGAWAPLKPRTIKRKGSNAILIDTAQLRQSITAEIVDPKVAAAT